jgi:hypothetical protein
MDTFLQSPTDDPIALEHLSVIETAGKSLDWLPPPEYDDALEWPIMGDLLETDVPIEEMTSRFEEHREQITQLIVDWGKRVKKEWASTLREGRKKDGLVMDPPRPRLPSSEAGSDPFEYADADTSLLLRADSFFTCTDYESDIRSYDVLIPSLHLGRSPKGHEGPFDLSTYIFHSQASAIARALLAALGRPDASGTEFNAGSSKWFRCGRCCEHRKAWSYMVCYASIFVWM